MAQPTLNTAEYTELVRRVGRMVGLDRDVSFLSTDERQDIEDIINAGLLKFYYPEPIDGDRFAHVWSFLKPITDITLSAPYSTGTIEIAAGVVTLTGGTWPANAADGELTVQSSSYTIASRDSDTQLTLDDTSVTVAAGATYKLGYPAYDLPEDYSMMDGPMTYPPGQGPYPFEVQIVREVDIRVRKQKAEYFNYPQRAAIRPKAPTPTTGHRFEIIFDPTPDAAYILTYRYKIDPNKLSATDKYALGGQAHAETMHAACIHAAQDILNDEPEGAYYSAFIKRLRGSVSHDRDAHSAETMGYNGDQSDAMYGPYQKHWDITNTGLVKINGTLP